MKGNKMKHRKAFVKEEREIQIINRLARVDEDMFLCSATAAEVARWLDLSATQTRKLLNSLVIQGVLVKAEEPYPGVCKNRYFYSFSTNYIIAVNEKKFRATPKPKRTIKINGQQLSIEVQ